MPGSGTVTAMWSPASFPTTSCPAWTRRVILEAAADAQLAIVERKFSVDEAKQGPRGLPLLGIGRGDSRGGDRRRGDRATASRDL